MSTRPQGGGSDRGQSTVEVALAMPLLCVLLLAVVQVAIVVRDQLLVVDAARVAARAAAVATDPAAAAATAGARAGPPGSRVATSVDGDLVTVRVMAVSPTDVPLIGALLPDVTLDATATMLLDPP